MTDQVFVGNIVLPDTVRDGWVLVADGVVQELGSGTPPFGEKSGGAGMLIMPGAIDSQVHSRSQRDQEDFAWSTKSAAAGGVTTIVDMPYDDGDLICTADRLTTKAREAAELARVDFALYATVDPAEGTRHIDDLVEAGAAAFKFSTFGTHPKRFPRIPPPLMHACFSAIAPHGLFAGVHNEDEETVRLATDWVKQQGIAGHRAHGLARPPLAEALATSQVYEIGALTGCPAHIVHCSIGRGYELAAAYRREGHEATIEACIHYLMLDEDDVGRLGGFAKVNPPIRSRREREALWGHLATGNVTVVSTDHVSWSRDRKMDPDILSNASGVPGLEILLPLLVKGLKEHGLPFSLAARLLAENPARLFRLDEQKGALSIGCDADIVVMAPAPYRYDPSASGNNVVDWSPYEGIELPYRVEETYLRGQLVAAQGKVLAEPGTGRFQRPTPKAA